MQRIDRLEMNKWLRRILKTTGGIAVGAVVLLGGATLLLNTESVQNKILKKAVELLSQKLETEVEIDSISISALTQEISLYGIEIEDREEREMLKVGKISVNLELIRLLQHKIVIEKAEIAHAKALLLKPSKEEPANYQFVIDAFKKPKDQKRPEKQAKKSKMDLDISALALKDIHVKHNELDIFLGEATYNKGWITDQTIEVDSITLACDTTFKAGLKPYSASLGHLRLDGDLKELVFKVDAYNLAYQWKSLWKKRNIMVDNQAGIGHLTVQANRGRYSATVKQAHYKNDNHLPRKNAGRPKRGFFDAKHLDVIADFHVVLDSIGKERITGHLNEFQAKDSVTGIDIRNLQTKFAYTKERISLRDITVQQKSTVLNVSSGEIVLPDKKEGREFSYATGLITGKAYLKDISRTFAPVLKNFSLPLNLSLTMKGTPNTISFRNIKVNTNDNKLQLAATGNITNLKDKYKLLVKFDVSRMHAKPGIAEKIINQFATKRMMIKQLNNLGDINYTGSFSVIYKKEIFGGQLQTDAGGLNFDFAIDNVRKDIVGKVSTKDLKLGKVMGIKNLGALAASADFNVDISKQRKQEMRKQTSGKLPICSFNATVEDCVYMGLHVRNLTANLKSDGAIATGDVYQSGKIRDLFFSYSFTNTDEMHKMRVTKPGIKFHKISDEYKAQKAERKMQKQLEKEDKKAQKEAAKQLKKQQKEEERAQKKQKEEQTGKKKKKFLIF